MEILDIINASIKPPLYAKGSAFMWTDKHISEQLLQLHINPDIDLASRKKESIQKTAGWILNELKFKGKLKILDLGCGPGLYSEIFAGEGHSVTGVDISETSIDYAINSAREKELDIEYLHNNYLDLKLEPNQFDLVVLIYTDFGVLKPVERDKLLALVHMVLKKDGIFIFDVLKDGDLTKKLIPKNWEASNGGFWKNVPHLALSESYLYEEANVILYQHIIVDSHFNLELYRFWTHFFSPETIMEMLEPYGFSEMNFRDNIIPESDIWNGENVLFSIISK